jgi:acyl carrier protein
VTSHTTHTGTLTGIVTWLVDTLRTLLSAGAEFTAQSDLIAAGLDSLAVTQLLLAIEDRTGVWLDEGYLTPSNLANAEALAIVIHERMAFR